MEDKDLEETKKKGRPSKVDEIDREVVWKLACMQCTLREIADVIGVNHETIRRHFSDLIEKGRSVGKKSLRRAQFEKALNGDTRLLVWLGKQYLGQQDSPDTGEDSVPLPWIEEDSKPKK
jgi:DNA-binding CsgD family transcriptional regulator